MGNDGRSSADVEEGIIQSPEIGRLRDRIVQVNRGLLDVLVAIDGVALQQQNPRIEAEYAARVGYLENELLARQLDARRARRRLTLAQMRANRGNPVDDAVLADIEHQLETELAEWNARLRKALEACAERLHNGMVRIEVGVYLDDRLAVSRHTAETCGRTSRYIRTAARRASVQKLSEPAEPVRDGAAL